MWWQDAVIYQIYPRSFQDSDGDGIGDLPGIERRLDHLAWLGVDALWLSPIYPSPMHDMGYDVADYKGVDPLFGTLEDFDRLVASARERGLRVVARPRALPHLDRAPVVHRAPRLVHLARRAEQLAVGVRRLGVVGSSTAASTCTRSIPSSRTSTGATRRWWRRCRTRSASGWSAAPPATAWTRSTGC